MRPWVLCLLFPCGLPPPPAAAGEAPWLALRATVLPSATFDAGSDGRLEGRVYRVAAALPGWQAGATALALGVDYDYTRYEYDGLDGRNRDLHRLELPLTASRDAGDWRLTARVAPGISASSNVFREPLTRWQRDDATLRVAVAAERMRGPWRWRVGLQRDRRFGRPLVYPAVAALAERGPLALELGLPDSRLSYDYAAARTLTARLYPAGHAWHVVSDELDDDFDYRVRAWRAELTWSAGLWRRLRLDVGAGYEFARRHRLTDDAGTRLDAHAASQFAITLGLRTAAAPLD